MLDVPNGAKGHPMREQKHVEVHMQNITLAVLVRALLAVLLTPVRLLCDWVYDSHSKIWKTPGGFGTNDPALAEQWSQALDMFEQLTGPCEGVRIVHDAIDKGVAPYQLLLNAFGWYLCGLRNPEEPETEDVEN